MNETILIADDDKDIRELVGEILKSEGYRVLKGENGIEALKKLNANKVDLAILDIMMPGVDGLELCRKIRETNPIPIIFLSAKATDVDKVIGLSTGADDYLVKPFSSIELTARIRAQIRRHTFLNSKSHMHRQEDTILLGGLEIHLASHLVTLFGNPVKLTKTEYEILLLMAKNPNQVFTLEQIFEQVWKGAYFDSNNTVMVHISRLRNKLNSQAGDSLIIKNVWGVGYKIEKETLCRHPL